jgi:tight adherence protein B
VSVAALSDAQYGELLFAVIALIALLGVWLFTSSSARRSLLIARGSTELRPRRRLLERLDDRVVRTRRGALLAGRLRSAGVKQSPAQFLGMVAGAAAGAFVVVALLFPVALAVVAAAVGGWACFAWLARRLDRRKEQFVGQLPEVARLLSNGASAGLSLGASIELAVREVESPARDELRTVVDELALGRSLDDSLLALQERLPSREIAVLMTTLIIQQRSGGDAVRALQELSDTLDLRRETLREVRTLMSGAVFTSYIVPVLGLGSLLLLNAINAKTLDRMTSSAVGIAALIVAGTLYALGSAAIRRVARVEL